MKSLTLWLVVLALAVPAQEAPKLRVVTTLGVLASVARAVGGDAVVAEALARPNENPHHVVGTPALMAAVSTADLFVEIGLSLEVWVENVLDGAGNPGVRRGAPGHVFAADGVRRRAVPAVLTRAGGDIHPEGNPHVWFDPLAVRQIAANVAEGLSRVAPAQREAFAARRAQFCLRLDQALFGPELVELLGGDVLARLADSGELEAFLRDKSFRGAKLVTRLGGWLQRAQALRNVKAVAYHDAWAHFAARFPFHIVGFVEEKPGIPPSAAHRDSLLKVIKAQQASVIVVLPWDDDTVARQLAEQTGARLVELPGDLGGNGAEDYFAFVDRLLAELLAGRP